MVHAPVSNTHTASSHVDSLRRVPETAALTLTSFLPGTPGPARPPQARLSGSGSQPRAFPASGAVCPRAFSPAAGTEKPNLRQVALT